MLQYTRHFVTLRNLSKGFVMGQTAELRGKEGVDCIEPIAYLTNLGDDEKARNSNLLNFFETVWLELIIIRERWDISANDEACEEPDEFDTALSALGEITNVDLDQSTKKELMDALVQIEKDFNDE